MGKRSTLFIPQDGDDFSAEWFTECLQPEYGAAVLEVNREVIGTGIGFVGEVYRCFLTWDAIREDLPASVIVKVPSKIPANRGLGEGLQLYEREIIAYRELSNGMGIPIPKVYYTAMDDDPTPWLDAVIEFLFTHLPPKGVNWLAVKFLELAGKSPAMDIDRKTSCRERV